MTTAIREGEMPTVMSNFRRFSSWVNKTGTAKSDRGLPELLLRVKISVSALALLTIMTWSDNLVSSTFSSTVDVGYKAVSEFDRTKC